jgi:hypothetical protein
MGSSFEDLEVWKKSCRLSVRLYKLLRDCHDYGMKDQMLRSSISIPSNIAEGSEQKSIPDFQEKTVNCEPTTVNGYQIFSSIYLSSNSI